MPKKRKIPDTYKIAINGDWSFEDLYVFPRAYEQVYFLVQSLSNEHDEEDRERINHSFRDFPWRGGYSAVNFYNKLKFVTPPKARPQIVSMHKASPGWFELALVVATAISVERLVKNVANSIDHTHGIYVKVVKGLMERKLLRLDVKRKELQFKQDELNYIESSLNQMTRILGLASLKEVNEKTGNPYVSLKILLSLYRRVRKLADYSENGKAKFGDSEV